MKWPVCLSFSCFSKRITNKMHEAMGHFKSLFVNRKIGYLLNTIIKPTIAEIPWLITVAQPAHSGFKSVKNSKLLSPRFNIAHNIKINRGVLLSPIARIICEERL